MAKPALLPACSPATSGMLRWLHLGARCTRGPCASARQLLAMLSFNLQLFSLLRCRCRPGQSLERAEQALADERLSNGDRLALQRRILRLGALAASLHTTARACTFQGLAGSACGDKLPYDCIHSAPGQA